MTTISTTPAYPVPGREMAITFTKSNAAADFIRVWITDAPVDTEERKNLEDSGKGRIEFYSGDSGSVKKFVPSKGGKYLFTTQEYTRIAGSHGGSYEDDPDGAAAESKVGSENSITLTVGQRMASECGAGRDLATLALYVFGDTIRSTTLDDQGEVTPAITDGTTDRASMALASTAVKSAASALAGVTVATAVDDPTAILSEMVAKFNAHAASATFHENADTDNPLDAGYASAITPDSFAQVVSNLLVSLRQHYTNDDGQGPGLAGTDPATGDFTPDPYHDVSGAKFDLTNAPLFSSASGVAESYRALADIWRSYEAHRVSTDVHDSADTTNALSALPALLEVHYQFFVQLAAISPTVPDTQTSGAVQLMTQVGATETDPS